MKFIVPAVIATLFAATQAHAFECSEVRALVAMVGEKKAIQIAREAGATDELIRAARECLKVKAQ